MVLATNYVTLVEPSALEALNINPGEYITFEVRDRGTGIPKEYLPRIFEPFLPLKNKGKALD